MKLIKTKKSLLKIKKKKLNYEISYVKCKSIIKSINQIEQIYKKKKRKFYKKFPYYNRSETITKIEKEIAKKNKEIKKNKQ